ALPAPHARLERVAGGEQQDRCDDPSRPRLRDDTKAVPPRQHHVEHDTPVCATQRLLECAVAGVGLGDAVALFAEGLAQEASQLAVVFDEEYLHESLNYGGPGGTGSVSSVRNL